MTETLRESFSEAAQETGRQTERDPRAVGPIAILGLMLYLVAFSAVLLYGLIRFWPATQSGDPTQQLDLLLAQVAVSDEVRLLLIVAMAGALGAMVHTLRSFYWYVGNRTLLWSWVAKYMLLPVVGATLSLVFYLVVRGGFFSTEATVDTTSPFGFAALSGLVGMFSEQAVLKLKRVAETMLEAPEAGKDSSPAGSD